MFADSAKFFNDIQFFEKELKRASERVIRRVTKKLYNNIVDRTPRDTGYARHNWKYTLDTPPYEPLPRPSKTFYEKPEGLFLQEIPFGSVITIYNNTPYIEYLEDGWSGQAPLGMVQISMWEAEADLDNAFRTLTISSR